MVGTPTPGLPVLPQSFLLLNPGFEEGQKGWAKYGGDFTISNGVRHGGILSGQLTSATDSTKYVYQVVVIDPMSAYEFSGYLRPQGNVKSAYLRISWYASFDGSGRALATDDSTAKLTGPANDFAYFTTGPVAPPPFARSARVRALLGPHGPSFATMLMDDFAFIPAGPAAALLKPPTLAEEDEDVIEEPEPTPRPKATPQPTRTPRPPRAAGAEPDETPEVVARIGPTRTRPEQPQLNSDGVPVDGQPQATEVLFLEQTSETVRTENYTWVALAIAFSALFVGSSILFKDVVRDYLKARS